MGMLVWWEGLTGTAQHPPHPYVPGLAQESPCGWRQNPPAGPCQFWAQLRDTKGKKLLGNLVTKKHSECYENGPNPETDTKCWQKCGRAGTHSITGGSARWLSLFRKTVQFFMELNIFVPYNPAIISGIYPKEVEMYVHTEICTWVFTAASFIVAKILKQKRSFSWWMNK